MRERFGRPPFIKYNKGSDWGLAGFDKALSEEDVAFIKENIKAINEKEVTWSPAEGSLSFLHFSTFPLILSTETEEKEFLVERAQGAAKRVLVATRGGRGGARGGRGGPGARGARSFRRAGAGAELHVRELDEVRNAEGVEADFRGHIECL